ncbi:hypothetical protein NB703_001153 [Pantoea ananatis]|uniref:Uncharacterized protein n=1 Tax=Pantoea ananas TaxID=553 RepID=A0AAJ1CWV5_PANAN|nr:hypothetical protein [Pantoea ananatis]
MYMLVLSLTDIKPGLLTRLSGVTFCRRPASIWLNAFPEIPLQMITETKPVATVASKTLSFLPNLKSVSDSIGGNRGELQSSPKINWVQFN